MFVFNVIYIVLSHKSNHTVKSLKNASELLICYYYTQLLHTLHILSSAEIRWLYSFKYDFIFSDGDAAERPGSSEGIAAHMGHSSSAPQLHEMFSESLELSVSETHPWADLNPTSILVIKIWSI